MTIVQLFQKVTRTLPKNSNRNIVEYTADGKTYWRVNYWTGNGVNTSPFLSYAEAVDFNKFIPEVQKEFH